MVRKPCQNCAERTLNQPNPLRAERDMSPATRYAKSCKAETIIRLLSSRPTSFFEASVRNLLMRDMKEDLEEAILCACSTADLEIIEGFQAWYHCRIVLVFCASPAELRKAAVSQLWSHGSVEPMLADDTLANRGFIRLWLSLDTSRSLRVPVWLSPNGEFVADDQDGETLVRDTCFVVMRCREYVKDWQMGAHTGPDYWTRAEDFIAKCRSGEIDFLQYAIEEDANETIP
ncbi:hypothetical protein DFH09DRAFT_1092117 [Mycena vulgaris]|nr:hypothetical protein DFH09DRAFT_1092117 [Mycena vulgaris]